MLNGSYIVIEQQNYKDVYRGIVIVSKWVFRNEEFHKKQNLNIVI